MEREFPAFRPSGGRGYVDFLATDSKGRVHVVETKIGNDEMLVLQGLDYWIWAQAHRNELGGYLQLDDRPAVVIDYVVAGDHGKHPVGPYSAPQAEALDRSIEWRFHVVEEWHDPDTPPTVATLPKRTAPDLPRITGRPFALRTQDRLAIRADGELYGGVLHADPTAGIHPAAMSTYESLDAAGLLHNMVHHVRSSQAFAINLFGPFDAEGAARLLRLAGVDVVDAESPQLEYVERDDRLGEVLYSKHPHQTQVDVFMKGTDRNGQVHGLLIEVKLTETDFGHCSAYQNPKNDALEVCAAVGGFGGDSERCFQLRNHGGSKRRSYDEFLGVVSPAPNPCGCVFRLGINQPMRNVALAGVLLDGNEIDVAHYALCAPRAHAAIWRRWAEAKTVLGTGRVNMFDLPADTVIALHDQPTALWLDGKYGHPTRESLGWHLACELYARHPGRFHLIETHPGGGQYDCLTLCDRDDLQLRVDINRVGSLHVAGLEELVSMAEVWDRLSAGRLGEVVQWCEQVIGEGRDASSDAAWVRIMSRLADELGHVARWQSGYLDSSGDEGGVRSGLFDAMPVVAEACRPERDDLIGEAAYRFWFLVDTTGRPIAAIELSSGSGWNIAGARFDLCTEAHDFVDQVEASIN